MHYHGRGGDKAFSKWELQLMNPKPFLLAFPWVLCPIRTALCLIGIVLRPKRTVLRPIRTEAEMHSTYSHST